MKKSSQNRAATTSVVTIPEQVSVAMAEIAENMGEGLLALAVGAGLQVMQALMEADVTAQAGPKGRHDPGRARGAARTRTRLGNPGWTPRAGESTTGAGRRWIRGVADRLL